MYKNNICMEINTVIRSETHVKQLNWHCKQYQ